MNPHPPTEDWEQFVDDHPEAVFTDAKTDKELIDRMHKAFTAGHAAGEMAERKRIVEKIQKTTI